MEDRVDLDQNPNNFEKLNQKDNPETETELVNTENIKNPQLSKVAIKKADSLLEFMKGDSWVKKYRPIYLNMNMNLDQSRLLMVRLLIL